MNDTNREDRRLACNLQALSPAQRQRYTELHGELRDGILDVDETPSGYGLRFAFHVTRVVALAEYMALEHLCCPFLELTLAIEEGGRVLLRLAGGEGVKAFLQAALDL